MLVVILLSDRETTGEKVGRKGKNVFTIVQGRY